MGEYQNQEFELEPKFSFDEMRALSPQNRATRTQELKQILNNYFARVSSQAEGNIFETGYDKSVIQALRDTGHDLWSWGYDGGSEVWGADYMKQTTNWFLKVEVFSDWTVNCEWVESSKLEKNNHVSNF